jgi:hypothetical protein
MKTRFHKLANVLKGLAITYTIVSFIGGCAGAASAHDDTTSTIVLIASICSSIPVWVLFGFAWALSEPLNVYTQS